MDKGYQDGKTPREDLPDIMCRRPQPFESREYWRLLESMEVKWKGNLVVRKQAAGQTENNREQIYLFAVSTFYQPEPSNVTKSPCTASR